ncbi:hypothetical protein ACJMK2_020541 [Sinanodonta woodiana]|uniref:Uncharacterized protein n=1 Tax=Sinanodonta woodiana TaxID=1069815 RepID=A0ABD3U2A8_SINWO
MAWCTLQPTQKHPTQGPLTPNPTTWTSLADACQDIVKFLGSNFSCNKRVVIYLNLPVLGEKIKIDLESVKAVGVICVLGIGFGLGSYLLYRLYHKIFSGDGDKSRCNTDQESEEEEEVNLDDDDFFIQIDAPVTFVDDKMGNLESRYPKLTAYYKRGEGVILGEGEGRHLRDVNLNTKGTYLRLRKHFNSSGDSEEGFSCTEREEITKPGCSNNVPECMVSVQREKTLNGFTKEATFQSVDLIDIVHDGTVSTSLSASLQGNFSRSSLSIRNSRLGCCETKDTENFCSIMDGLKYEVNSVQGKHNRSPAVFYIEHDLGASSVLLTPPSEDDEKPVENHVSDMGSKEEDSYYSVQAKDLLGSSTDTSVSTIAAGAPSQHKTNDSLALVEDMNDYVCSNESFDNKSSFTVNSPPQSAQSSEKSDNSQFHKILLRKLDRLHSERHDSVSTYSSKSETPSLSRHDSFLTFSRHDSFLTFSRHDSLSGISSPELEVLMYGTADVNGVSSEKFDVLENEIHCIEDEFQGIVFKLDELKAKYNTDDYALSNSLNELEIHKSIPTIPNVPVTSMSESDNSSMFISSQSISGAEPVDLSWDMESLDNVLAETSLGTFSSEYVAKSLGLSLDIDGCNKDCGSSCDQDILHSHSCSGAQNCLIRTSDCTLDNVSSLETEYSPAYAQIPCQSQYSHLRQIRGDNYCGIRSVLCQILLNNLPLFSRWSSKAAILEGLEQAFNDESLGLRAWNFTGHKLFEGQNLLQSLSQCLVTLYDKALNKDLILIIILKNKMELIWNSMLTEFNFSKGMQFNLICGVHIFRQDIYDQD